MGSIWSSAIPEAAIEGYQVLHVYENSPAKNAGFEAFFDFIVAFCGVKLSGDDDAFLGLLKSTKLRELELKVFSVRTKTFRNVRVIADIDSNGEISLGMTIRYRSIKDAHKYVHRVLEVLPDSPACKAGLRPFSDYIIGAETGSETEDMDFMTLIGNYDRQQLKLFVYNSEENNARAVILEPNSQWTSDNSLGCGLGTGYIHRIPLDRNRTPRRSQSIQYCAFRRPGPSHSNLTKSLPTLPHSEKASDHSTENEVAKDDVTKNVEKDKVKDAFVTEETIA